MLPKFPNISDFPALESLIQEFPKTEVFLVGGAVRDILLGRKVTDIDMLVRNIKADDLEEFLANHGRVVFAGKRFGVWKFNEINKPDNEICDIALPRTEFSMHKAGIYQDFKVKTNPFLPIEEDLKRRDFTINSMAYNLSTKELIDPNNGQQDLKNKIIKTVGSPRERFQEDYSRMLRALRFSLQLDSKIETQTLKTIKNIIPNINNELEGKRVLPQEIISEEFLKSLKLNPIKTIDLWDSVGALNATIPELLEMKNCAQPIEWHLEGDVWEHTMLAIKNLASKEYKKEFGDETIDIELILAVLFHDIGKPFTLKIPDQNTSHSVAGKHESSGIDKLKYDEHNQIGAKLTKQILERLRASSSNEIGININNVVWMVKNHMLLMHGDPDLLRPITIEKYFFSNKQPSRNFLKLLYVDGLSSIGKDGKSSIGLYKKICKRITQIKLATKSSGNKLALPLITGEDVMQILNLKPSKKIGKLLEDIREKQLKGELLLKKDALDYLKQL